MAVAELVTRAKALGRTIFLPQEIRRSWGFGGGHHCMLLLALEPAWHPHRLAWLLASLLPVPHQPGVPGAVRQSCAAGAWHQDGASFFGKAVELVLL